jgi:hypothetical protein
MSKPPPPTVEEVVAFHEGSEPPDIYYTAANEIGEMFAELAAIFEPDHTVQLIMDQLSMTMASVYPDPALRGRRVALVIDALPRAVATDAAALRQFRLSKMN